MTKRILCTGGCGFIGSHFVEHVLRNTDWEIVVWDKLTYAANGMDRLRDIEAFDDGRVHVLTCDFSEPLSPGVLQETGEVQYVIHIGAETHVDRSIEDAEPFVRANVLGTMRVLDFARRQNNLRRFIQFVTDEVYGPAPDDVAYKEGDAYNPTNPYSATKAGAAELALAYRNTHRIPVVCVFPMNCFGERQHPEKFVPKIIRAVLNGETVPIHASADRKVAGSRYWIHARNVADAVLFLLRETENRPPKCHIVGQSEIDNLTMAQRIAKLVGKPLYHRMVNFHESRPGHDLRYALCGDLLHDLGWRAPKPLDQSLDKTIRWTLEHPAWLELGF